MVWVAKDPGLGPVTVVAFRERDIMSGIKLDGVALVTGVSVLCWTISCLDELLINELRQHLALARKLLTHLQKPEQPRSSLLTSISTKLQSL